jgi:hypothetical protein
MERTIQLLAEETMKQTRLPLPYVGLIAATRTVLGAGIGLLAAQKLREGARRRAGFTLLLIGALSTIPLVAKVLSGTRQVHAT